VTCRGGFSLARVTTTHLPQSGFQPVDRVVQLDDIADNDERRCLEVRGGAARGTSSGRRQLFAEHDFVVFDPVEIFDPGDLVVAGALIETDRWRVASFR